MTKRVTRKLFKNGGSWAIRIPKGWLPEDGEFDVVVREDGVVEIRPLDRETRMKNLLTWLASQPPIPEEEFPIPKREVEPERFDWDELWNGEMK
jgi:virulence-associated protein VagC